MMWQHTLMQRLPHEPEGADAAYEEFVENILPVIPWAGLLCLYMGNGTQTGAPIPGGDHELQYGGGNHVSNMVEEQVVNWMKDLLGMPGDFKWITVSGGSIKLRRVGRGPKRQGRLQRPAGDRGCRCSPKADRVHIQRGA